MSDSADRTNKLTAYLDVASVAADKSLPAEQAAAIAAAFSSPRFQRMKAEQLRIAARGTPALVLLEGPMPSGVLGLIRLQQPGPLSRFIVASKEGFRDDVMDRLLSLAHRWQSENPDDESSMAGTLFVDGRYTIVSDKSGERTGVQRLIRMGSNADAEIMSADLLARANATEPQEIPGVGLGRVVTLN